MTPEEKKLLKTAIGALRKLVEEDDDTDKPANDTGKKAGEFPLRKNEDDEARASRDARRAKMGLAPIGGAPKAIRVEGDKFVFSVDALAQSKAAKVRA